MPDWLQHYEEPIELSSGAPSHWFVDARTIYAHSTLVRQVMNTWRIALSGWPQEERWHFVGVPEGGMRWAFEFSGHMGATYGRPDDPVPGGRKVVVIEDVVTTGQSMYAVARQFGSPPTLVVVSRNPDVNVTCAWATIDLREDWGELHQEGATA